MNTYALKKVFVDNPRTWLTRYNFSTFSRVTKVGNEGMQGV